MTTQDLSAINNLLKHGPHKREVGRKQLTLALGGLYIASTTPTAKPELVWEAEKGYARYYLPIASLHEDVKRAVGDSGTSSSDSSVRNGASDMIVSVKEVETIKGDNGRVQAQVERLTVGSKSTTWVRFVDGALKGLIRFERSEIDDWFENGAIFIGIKNPYKRIDTAPVSHHIVVKIDGEIVADTNVAVLLNETGLKETYYIPATSIKDWGSVEKSSLRTACPYKGEAWYLNITVKGKKYENLIWYYPYPTHESAGVQGLISFYNREYVEILVNGVGV